MSGFFRHIDACNTAHLPGERLRLRIAGQTVGFVDPGFADVLAAFAAVRRAADGLTVIDPAALPTIGRAVAEAGHCRFRDEAFDVRAAADGPALAQIDRGALPKFGIRAVGVHVNGLVRRPDGLHLWVGVRAANKALDPGKLDHLVAGGVPAGLTAEQTLIKEAGEEAGLSPDVAAEARRVGRVSYAMAREGGLRRDVLLCYDLDLPEDFTPHPVDGEVARFGLWPIARAFAAVRDGDDFKFNVNLVLIDLFLRLGLIGGDEAAELRAGLERKDPPQS